MSAHPAATAIITVVLRCDQVGRNSIVRRLNQSFQRGRVGGQSEVVRRGQQMIPTTTAVPGDGGGRDEGGVVRVVTVVVRIDGQGGQVVRKRVRLRTIHLSTAATTSTAAMAPVHGDGAADALGSIGVNDGRWGAPRIVTRLTHVHGRGGSADGDASRVDDARGRRRTRNMTRGGGRDRVQIGGRGGGGVDRQVGLISAELLVIRAHGRAVGGRMSRDAAGGQLRWRGFGMPQVLLRLGARSSNATAGGGGGRGSRRFVIPRRCWAND